MKTNLPHTLFLSIDPESEYCVLVGSILFLWNYTQTIEVSNYNLNHFCILIQLFIHTEIPKNQTNKQKKGISMTGKVIRLSKS